MSVRLVRREIGKIEVYFPYDQIVVEMIRAVPGRVWLPEAMHWVIPEKSLTDLLERLGDREYHFEDLTKNQFDWPEKDEFSFLRKRFDQELRIRGYSPKTRKAYIRHIELFRSWVSKSLKQVEYEDIHRYLLHMVDDKQVSRSYLNQAISAIKIVYGKIIRKPMIINEVPRPRREKKLPSVLSRKEVLKIINVVTNPKHINVNILCWSPCR